MSLTVVPSVDLRAGRVVRLRQGDFGRQIDYDLDPVTTVSGFADTGAKLVHVVDLDGAKEGRVAQAALAGRIARAVRIPVQVGGGVRSTGDVQRLLDAGAARVVVGTAAFKDWPWFETLVGELPGTLVLAVDAKAGRVATHGWTETSDVSALDVARRVRGWPLAGLLYTDVARDGMLGGTDVDGTAALAAATDVPVLASGGVGSLDDVRALVGRGIWGVILGRSLHDGRIALSEALRIAP